MDRLFISTDMQMITGVNNVVGDKDDVQSLVHALLYQDKYNIVGIASTTSKHQPGKNDESFIHHVIDQYAKDQSKLIARDDAFKTADELRDITYQGTKYIAGSSGIVPATEASNAIIREARAADAAGEHLYVATWGGLGDVARALRDAPDIADDIRLLSASGPAQEPNAYKYLVDTFAGEGALWWIDAQTTQRGIYASPEGRLPPMSDKWSAANAKGHGALGDFFHANTQDVRGTADTYNAVKMGDSFGVFYLIDKANNDDPTAESWGGEYHKAGDKYWVDRTYEKFGWDGSNGAPTTYEDRAAWTGDFAARLDWLTSSSTTAPQPAKPAAPSEPAPPASGSGGTGNLVTGKAINGTSADNVLTGTSGADTIDGKAGSDQMTGGAGNDVYHVDRSGDRTIEAANGGHDTVHASVGWTLSANVEDLYLRTSATIDGTGNELGNMLIGNSAANRLDGKAGADRLEGRGGNDRLTGGTGNDTLTGGEGDDLFIFAAGHGNDVITDFVAGGSQDRIQISGYKSYQASQVGNDTLIKLGSSDSILLKGVDADDLRSSDFIFA